MKLVAQRNSSISIVIGSYVALTLIGTIVSGCTQSAPVDDASLYVREIENEAFTVEYARETSGRLALHRDGDAYECSMCHDGFSGDPNIKPLEGEHADIDFDHGLNQSCLNCHNSSNSDAYINHEGMEIPGDQSSMLCAKCHGVTFREWEVGVHGLLSGHWDDSFGPRKKLDCVQCHDPHNPAFPVMKPDPAPIFSRFAERAKQAE